MPVSEMETKQKGKVVSKRNCVITVSAFISIVILTFITCVAPLAASSPQLYEIEPPENFSLPRSANNRLHKRSADQTTVEADASFADITQVDSGITSSPVFNKTTTVATLTSATVSILLTTKKPATLRASTVVLTKQPTTAAPSTTNAITKQQTSIQTTTTLKKSTGSSIGINTLGTTIKSTMNNATIAPKTTGTVTKPAATGTSVSLGIATGTTRKQTAIAAASSIATPACVSDQACPFGWALYNDNCYMITSGTTTASNLVLLYSTFCTYSSARPASILNYNENKFITDLIHTQPVASYFIGLYCSFISTPICMDSSPLNYTNWKTGYGCNTLLNVVSMSYDDNGLWTLSSTTAIQRVVCKMKACTVKATGTATTAKITTKAVKTSLAATLQYQLQNKTSIPPSRTTTIARFTVTSSAPVSSSGVTSAANATPSATTSSTSSKLTLPTGTFTSLVSAASETSSSAVSISTSEVLTTAENIPSQVTTTTGVTFTSRLSSKISAKTASSTEFALASVSTAKLTSTFQTWFPSAPFTTAAPTARTVTLPPSSKLTSTSLSTVGIITNTASSAVLAKANSTFKTAISTKQSLVSTSPKESLKTTTAADMLNVLSITTNPSTLISADFFRSPTQEIARPSSISSNRRMSSVTYSSQQASTSVSVEVDTASTTNTHTVGISDIRQSTQLFMTTDLSATNNIMPTTTGEIASGERTTVQPVFTELKWGEWTPWTSCSAPCGIGKQLRIQLCGSTSSTCRSNFTNHNNRTLSYTVAWSTCRVACPVDGVWTPWTAWSSCSVTCGAGSVSRERRCLPPVDGGRPCEGQDTDVTICQLESCTQSSASLGGPTAKCSGTQGPAFTTADKKPSSIAVGVIGIIIMCSVGVVIVVIDLILSTHVTLRRPFAKRNFRF